MTISGFFRKLLRTHDRRHHYRMEQPVLSLTIEGREYTTLNWSLGGLRIGQVPGSLVRGEKVEGSIRLPPGGEGTFAAEVVDITDQGHTQLRLLEISPAVFVAMSGLRGS